MKLHLIFMDININFLYKNIYYLLCISILMIRKEDKIDTNQFDKFVIEEITRIYKIFNNDKETAQTIIEIMLVTILRANGCGKMVINVKDGEFLNYINEKDSMKCGFSMTSVDIDVYERHNVNCEDYMGVCF